MDTMKVLTQSQTDAWIGATVKTIMQARLMDTHELAGKVGMTDQTLRNRIRGDRAWSAHELIRLGEVLDVEPGELLSGWGGRVAVPFKQPTARGTQRDVTPEYGVGSTITRDDLELAA